MDFLTQFMLEINKHFTLLGKTWLMIFIFFHVVFFAVICDSLILDEQSFLCNSSQPGCQTVCFDAFAPLSHVNFWFLQIFLITAPTVMFLGYAMYKVSRRWRDRRCGEESHDMYIPQLLVRLISDVWGLVVQYIFYGFEVAHMYECNFSPCLRKVPCFVSRPTEKTIFLWIMYAVGSTCLCLTALESLHLGFICWIRCTSRGKKTTNVIWFRLRTVAIVSPLPGIELH